MTDTAYLKGIPPRKKELQVWVLEGETAIIGRQPSADITLLSLRISRQHARITHKRRGYFIEDLGSRNGTFVNGYALGSVPQRLSIGDEIVLGGAATLRFEDPHETIDGEILGRMEGIWINHQMQEVWVDAKQVQPPLSAAQYALLLLLYEEEGNVISRERIIAHVWADMNPEGISADAVNGLIKRLRARLKDTQPESWAFAHFLSISCEIQLFRQLFCSNKPNLIGFLLSNHRSEFI